ncbi:hypothetical protein ACH0CG_02560 [Microbacterium sp. 179-I 1D1 NHS]|uniref:hypothetical protein n=1 Tax=Microbacterium sp. 179-I 1D1 NHS TaxID=3374298 RepID=UPI003879BDE0
MSDYWVTIGLAALIGVVVGALINIWSVARTIEHKSVIEERQKWRDSLRDLIPRLVGANGRDEREQARNAIFLRLNPYRDQEAMRLVDRYLEIPSRQTGLDVVAHMQRLLKHDWERAKIESSIFPVFASRRADGRTRRQADSGREVDGTSSTA